MTSSFLRFLDHTQRRTTVGRTPLDERSARRRDVYPTTHCFCFPWRCGPTRAITSSFLRFLDHTQRRTTVGRTPLDERSARRRDVYPTTHNHNRRTSMPPVGFEPTLSASERPQICVLDRAATGTGNAPCFNGRKDSLKIQREVYYRCSYVHADG